jgi:hypothetical protein
MDIQQLYQLISAVAPIEGVNSDGVISFLESATTEQRTAAQEVVNDNLGNLGVEPQTHTYPILHRGEFENGLLNLGILTYADLRQSYRDADLPYPIKQIVDAAVAGGTPTPEQLQAAPYNLPAPIATGVAQAIAGGLTLTAAERDKIAYTWVSMSIVERHYPLVAQLGLVLGISDAIMDQLFLKRGESTNG